MFIQTFVGRGVDAARAAAVANDLAQSLLQNLSEDELWSVEALALSDEHGYTHIITVVYK
jgi:hypothetical protein